MKFLPYVFKHLRHRWLRTLSTVAAIAVAIVLFCVLQTVLDAIDWATRSARSTRLITQHAVSFIYNIPRPYMDKIAALPHVARVASSTYFFGFRGASADFSTFFPNFAIDAEPYLDIYPEFILTPAERRAFLADRRGCIIGPGTAAKHGIRVGDVIQLTSVIPRYRTSQPLELVVEAIFATDSARFPGTPTDVLFFHWGYLREATGGREDGVMSYVVEVTDPQQAPGTIQAIDALFANSARQTKTQTEAANRASFVSLVGNLGLLLRTVGLAVSFTILLVTANTMSVAVRERRREIGVLKTLGFSGARVLGLILSEAVFIGLAGGLLGLVLSRSLLQALLDSPAIGGVISSFPNLGITPRIIAMALGLAGALGVGAGLVPALLAYRARITQSLRTV